MKRRLGDKNFKFGHYLLIYESTLHIFTWGINIYIYINIIGDQNVSLNLMRLLFFSEDEITQNSISYYFVICARFIRRGEKSKREMFSNPKSTECRTRVLWQAEYQDPYLLRILPHLGSSLHQWRGYYAQCWLSYRVMFLLPTRQLHQDQSERSMSQTHAVAKEERGNSKRSNQVRMRDHVLHPNRTR